MIADYEWQMTCPMCGTSHPEDSEQAEWLSTTKATPAMCDEQVARVWQDMVTIAPTLDQDGWKI